jgi:hypothetical protein
MKKALVVGGSMAGMLTDKRPVHRRYLVEKHACSRSNFEKGDVAD